MSEMRRIKVGELGDPLDGFCLAGFEEPCLWGDWIIPGDVVCQIVEGRELGSEHGTLIGWEHRECGEAERAVFVRPDR